MPDLLPRRLASSRRHVLTHPLLRAFCCCRWPRAALPRLRTAARLPRPAERPPSQYGSPAPARRSTPRSSAWHSATTSSSIPVWRSAELPAVGSSAGISRFTAGRKPSARLARPASTADLAGARGGPAVQVPVDLGAVVVASTWHSPDAPRLKLTGAVLGRIFLGQITRWDDPAITALNPGVHLRVLAHHRCPSR